MEKSWIIFIVISIFVRQSKAVRLHKLFLYLDGYKSDYNLRGFLHVGTDYTVFLRLPKPHDKFLVYELYEAKNIPENEDFKPKLLAISKIPVDYIKEQLKIYREELYQAKYVNENTVPGTRVKSLREWQIEKVLHANNHGSVFDNKAPILRSVVV